MTEPLFHIVVILVLLVGGGYLPALVLSRDPVLAVVLAPAASAVLGTLAAVAATASRTPLAPWVVLFTTGASAAAVLLCRRRGLVIERRIQPVQLLLPVLAAAACMVMVRRAPIDWDARSIWFFHAHWFASGGDAVAASLQNPALVFSHPDYPVLVPGAVAFFWWLLSPRDLELGQMVISLLVASMITLLGVAVQAASSATNRIVSGLIGAAVVLAAYGIGGPTTTNGYADSLWSAALVAAAIALLVAPPSSAATAIGALGLLVATLTKNEGLSVGLAVAVLHVVRRRDRRSALLAVSLVPALLWMALARAHGAENDLMQPELIEAMLRGRPEVWDRLGPAVERIWAYCKHDLRWSAGIAVAGLLLLRRERRRTVGPALYLWLAGAAAISAVLVAYLISPHDLTWHLDTSVDRTTIAPRLFLVGEIALWTVTATAVATARVRSEITAFARPARADRAAAEEAPT